VPEVPTREEGESVTNCDEISRLRYLLWCAWSNCQGYGDDGELQFEGMDFKRGAVELLERKMQERNAPMIAAYFANREKESK